ncbi:MAG: hypothetical protein ACKVS8_05870 [Phycisphaerales bacterium]
MDTLATGGGGASAGEPPDGATILSIAAAALRDEEARWQVEQAARGLDSLSEVEIHSVLAAGLANGCGGVLCEQPYPAQWRGKKGRRKVLPEESERQRCDLVIVPRGATGLGDSLREARAVEAIQREVAGTLYEGLATQAPLECTQGTSGPGAKTIVAPEDAYWLEVKVVGQYCYTQGVPGPNGTYASELVRGVSADIRKLRDDPGIVRCGVLMVLFAADGFVADNDVAALAHRCLDKGLPLRWPLRERVAIVDRIGNGFAEVCLFEVAKA